MLLRYVRVQCLQALRKLSYSRKEMALCDSFRSLHYTTASKVCANRCRRLSSFTTNRMFSETSVKLKKAKITVTYVKADGERITVEGKEGDNLLDIAVNNNVDLEGFGACEGTLSCSTCHLIFKKSDYDAIGEEPTDEELDMLDLAFGRTPTSRLGCQVCVTKKIDGLEVHVPAGVLDARDA